MYRIIIAIIVVIIILSLGIADQIFINYAFDEAIERTENISSALRNEEIDKAYEQVSDMLVWWRKKRDYLELTCPHNEVKDMANYIAQIQGSIISKQYDDAIALTNLLKEDAQTKLNILAYRLKNVF